jgi:hypothetical protein
LDCQSNLKNGFGFGLTITYLQWIWIGLTIQKNWIEQQPAYYQSNIIIKGKLFDFCYKILNKKRKRNENDVL